MREYLRRCPNSSIDDRWEWLFAALSLFAKYGLPAEVAARIIPICPPLWPALTNETLPKKVRAVIGGTQKQREQIQDWYGQIRDWNVGGVTCMVRLFENACDFNEDLSGWDVSQVTDMACMFNAAESFNQDLSSWHVSGVTDMVCMFRGAKSFNQDLGGWDVSQVTTMAHMFDGATSFNQDLSGWKVSATTDMAHMFNNATSLDQEVRSWPLYNANTTCTHPPMNCAFWEQD